MDLENVSEEIRATLGAISGLRVPVWGVTTVKPPAALVALPESISFDETYGRGKDRFPDLPVIVLVGAPEQRASRQALAEYADGSGARSVKTVLEGHAWVACESVHVGSAEFDVMTFAGTGYLAAVFHLDIIGKGTPS